MNHDNRESVQRCGSASFRYARLGGRHAWLSHPAAAGPLGPPQALQPVPIDNSIGCFKDQGDPQGTAGRDLSGSIVSIANMTNFMCRSQCGAQGYRYAGTQVGTYCFCGNSYGNSGPSNACTTPCAGNPGEICGGIWSNSVYQAIRQKEIRNFPGLGGGQQIPPKPANGGQCTISFNNSAGYDYLEVQTWTVTGPPTITMNAGMVALKRYPLQWTTSGRGTIGATTWTILGGNNHNALLLKTLANTSLLFSRETTTNCEPGALQTNPIGQWCEFGAAVSYPTATLPSERRGTTTYPISRSVRASAGQMSSMPTWGYQEPPLARGTAHCEWHVAF